MPPRNISTRRPFPSQPVPSHPGPRWAWERDTKLRALGFANYAEYISSTAWYEVRRRYQESGWPQDCQLCGETEKIQLHHRTYERVGCEELSDLVPLCIPCHQMVHTLEKRGDLVGFDGEAISQLVDAAQAKKNRVAEAARVARQRGEYLAANPAPDKALDDARVLALHVKDALRRAIKETVDISAEIQEIRAVLDRIHRHIDDEREQRRNAA